MSVKVALEKRHRPLAHFGWRAQELAKLALSRISWWSARDISDDGEFDYGVIDVKSGDAFMVEVETFPSIHSARNFKPDAKYISFNVSESLVKAARSKRCPVFLFVFDVVTDHGRYVRLDTVKLSESVGGKISLRLPIENTISKDGILRLARELEKK